MKKGLVIWLSIAGVVIVALIAFATYIGVMPILSDWFAPKEPKDLGVTWTDEDFTNGNAKMGSPKLEALPAETPPEQSVVYEGTHEAEFRLTSSEVTALANGGKWRYVPLSSIQVKIGDGGAQASAMLDTSKVAAYMAGSGGGYEDASEQMKKYDITGTVPVYGSASGGVENGKVSMSIGSVAIGKYRFPGAIVSPYKGRAVDFIESRIANVSGLRLDSVKFEGGELDFKGAVPDVERTAQ